MYTTPKHELKVSYTNDIEQTAKNKIHGIPWRVVTLNNLRSSCPLAIPSRAKNCSISGSIWKTLPQSKYLRPRPRVIPAANVLIEDQWYGKLEGKEMTNTKRNPKKRGTDMLGDFVRRGLLQNNQRTTDVLYPRKRKKPNYLSELVGGGPCVG